MVTVPPEPTARPTRAGPHRARQVAEGFGSDAERYDRTRPRYPKVLTDRIVAASPGPRLLDVGIGTGVSALGFQAAKCSVLGVEPDERMATFARQRGFEVEVAAFEEWDPAGRSFDTVIAGQAWHWVDPHAGATKAAGLLHPDGNLAVFWNVFQPPPDLAEAFTAVYRQVLPDSPAFSMAMPRLETYSNLFERAEGGIRDCGGFAEPERWQVDWERPYTKAEWLDQVPTFGGHSQFPHDRLERLLAGLGVTIDATGGSFTMRYAAVAVTAARTRAA